MLVHDLISLIEQQPGLVISDYAILAKTKVSTIRDMLNKHASCGEIIRAGYIAVEAGRLLPRWAVDSATGQKYEGIKYASAYFDHSITRCQCHGDPPGGDRCADD